MDKVTYGWFKCNSRSEFHRLRWARFRDPVETKVNGLGLDLGRNYLIRELVGKYLAKPAEEVDGRNIEDLSDTAVERN